MGEVAGEAIDRASRPPLQVLDASAWATQDPPPLRYLVDGLLPEGKPAILAARSNAGKSLLAMQLSFAVATGRGLFGRRGPREPMRVLFVELEDDPGEIQRRWRRCLNLFREDPDWTAQDEAALLRNWRAVVPDWKSAVGTSFVSILPHLLEQARTLCADGAALGLVVLDTFAALSEGEENRAEVQRAFWGACYALADRTGCTPLVIHHVKKPFGSKNAPGMDERLSFDQVRGSSAIVAGARAVIQAEPITPEEAARLSLDEDRARAGNFLVLALTKTVSGPKGAWMALEQRQAGENGAGFFVPMLGGDRVCAALKSKAATAGLSQVEAVLLSIAEDVPRDELVARHWPEESPEKGEKKLKSVLSHLRGRYKWLEPGRGLRLSQAGLARVQAMKSLQGADAGDFQPTLDGEEAGNIEHSEVPTGDFPGDFGPNGTRLGAPARSQRRMVPPVPEGESPQVPNPLKGNPGDLGTLDPLPWEDAG